MSGWRIAPDGVQQVVSSVGEVAARLNEAVTGLETHVQSAVTATAESPVIADALVGFFDHHRPTLEAIGNRISSATGGAVAATTWYLTGDQEMAAQQQSAAATAVDGAATFTLPER